MAGPVPCETLGEVLSVLRTACSRELLIEPRADATTGDVTVRFLHKPGAEDERPSAGNSARFRRRAASVTVAARLIILATVAVAILVAFDHRATGPILVREPGFEIAVPLNWHRSVSADGSLTVFSANPRDALRPVLLAPSPQADTELRIHLIPRAGWSGRGPLWDLSVLQQAQPRLGQRARRVVTLDGRLAMRQRYRCGERWCLGVFGPAGAGSFAAVTLVSRSRLGLLRYRHVLGNAVDDLRFTDETLRSAEREWVPDDELREEREVTVPGQ